MKNDQKPWYHLLDEAEQDAQREPGILVEGAIRADDMIVALGDPRFWEEFKKIHQSRIVIRNVNPQDNRYSVINWREAVGHSGRAAILQFSGPSKLLEWFKCEASAVFEAENPHIARVLKLRDFDDYNRVLRFRDGRFICEKLDEH